MRDLTADWRHYTLAGLLLALMLGLLWWYTLGSKPAPPTAGASAGARPLKTDPNSP